MWNKGKGLFWLLAWIIYGSVLTGCVMGESVIMQNQSDGWSTIKFIQEASVARENGRDDEMYEYILKAGFRWQYERSCYEPVDEVRENVDSTIPAYLSSGASVLGQLRRDNLTKYAEILAGMQGWKLAPTTMDDQTHDPGYEYKQVNLAFCADKSKELQNQYDQFHKNTYALFSNKEYQELDKYIRDYERKSVNQQELEEEKYLDAVNRKTVLEEKYDFGE